MSTNDLEGHRADRVFIDDPNPPPLLDREPSDADREAEADEPRPGVWAGHGGADLRQLTQTETDMLIRCELCMKAAPDELAELQRACGISNSNVSDGRPTKPMFEVHGERRIAWCQRGGIDSDALVRILARRAWGDRDRRWFALQEKLRAEFGFDRISIHRDEMARATMVTADRSGRSAGTQVTDHFLSSTRDPYEALRSRYSELDLELTRAGAPRKMKA